MNAKVAAVLLVLVVAGVAGYSFLTGVTPLPDSDEKVSVVASLYPVYFFAKEIGGDRASVSNLLPAGVAPHDYEPTPQEIARIERSALFIINGGIEKWAERIKKNLNPAQTIVVRAAEGMMADAAAGGGGTVFDPHFWLSPALAVRMAENIADGFVRADQKNGWYYRANAEALKAKLEALDAEYRVGLAACQRRDLVTSHAAFGYLAAAYGLNQVALRGLSPEEDPSPQELARIIEFAKKNNVRHVFFETLASPKLAETVAREISAETLVLNPLEGLTDDELASGKDYWSEMRHNLKNIKFALQCTP